MKKLKKESRRRFWSCSMGGKWFSHVLNIDLIGKSYFGQKMMAQREIVAGEVLDKSAVSRTILTFGVK